MTQEQAKKELDRGTPAELICATCPWDRLCVEPPTMTEQDLRRRMDEAERNDEQRDPERKGLPTGMMLTALAYGGRVDAGKLCPVFALRLRGPDGRKAADAVRELMRTWGEPS